MASQLATHAKYGGVVPELASREHLRAIVPVVREALARASVSLSDLSAVAATEGPGLVGSLLVGLTYAKALAFARRLPLIAVNHLEGHIHAVLLEAGNQVQLPALALIVSGGHTHLFHLDAAFRYRLLGKTRDDAAGEAFDKVAKLLGFPYPGGPVIDQLAPHGNPQAFSFTLARMKGNPQDFSFSGLKTAILRIFQRNPELQAEAQRRRQFLRAHPRPTPQQLLELTSQTTLDLLASFQATVLEELALRIERALASEPAFRCVIVSGGVACNTALRLELGRRQLPVPVLFPSPSLSTDNAAMIAAAAFPKLARGEFAGLDLKAKAGLALA